MARAVLRTILCAIFIGGAVFSAPSAGSIPHLETADSPLDLLYQTAQDDLNSISVDVSAEVATEAGSEVGPHELTEVPAAAGETAVPGASSTTSVPETLLGSSTALANGLTARVTPSSTSESTTTGRTRVDTASNGDDGDDGDDGDHGDGDDDDNDNDDISDPSLVNIKKKRPTTPQPRPFWDAFDDSIERDIITKIFQGASQNHERARNRNLRRLLRRFQVLALRADLSADEFHKFMRLVSEYTPSRIPTFLLRKSERRQFQEANRVRWKHIRERMQEIGHQSNRDEVIENFLSMVERDGALIRRFYTRPRTRTRTTIEDQIRFRPAFMNRFLASMSFDEHPLLKHLLNGAMLPSEFPASCCKF